MKISQARLIIFASVGLALLLIIGAIGYIYYDRNQVLRYNEKRFANANLLLSEFIDKFVDGIDRVLLASSRHIAGTQGLVGEEELRAKLADFAIGVSGLSGLFALGPEGAPIVFTRQMPRPTISFADRPYFTEAMAPDRKTVAISETMMSRVANRWHFFASRPIVSAGKVTGVIAASIDTGMFEGVLSAYRPDPGIVVGLYTTGFRLVARAPEDTSLFGRSFAASQALRASAAAATDSITLTAPSPIDGAERLYAVRRVGSLPLILTVSVPVDQILAQWRAHSRIMLSLSGLFGAVIVFVGIAGAHVARRQEEVSALLDTMFSQTPACIAIANTKGALIKSNENWGALGDLFEVPAGLRPDAFMALQHAIQHGGDDGLTEDRQKFLAEIGLIRSGAKRNAALELRCRYEGADRYFTVSISRIVLAPETKSEGFAVLVVDISKQRALELRLRSQLLVDSQTGLATRAGFMAILTTRIAQAVGEDCLFVFDIVGLAELKELRGFSVSDEAFSAVGAKLGALAANGCIAGRIDSEKFCLFMPSTEHGVTAAQRLQRLVSHLSQDYHLEGHTFNVRMTVGGARVAEVGQDAGKLLQAAEIAHGLARRRGLSSSAFFNAKIEADAHERVRLYGSLQKALSGHEFELEYQPKVDLESGTVIGAEALVRWRHPIFGLQPPARFIPIAEESGLIVPIGDWVMGEVIRMLADWPRIGPRPVPISINVSAAQFDRESVDTVLAGHLARYGVDPAMVVVELTESIFSLQIEDTVAKINRIREMGVRVSLDDFGTGYSSLSYLNLMNFDELKVDGSFVHNLTTDSVSRSIIEMTLGLARTLDVSVTAEGIETEDQRRTLIAMGCRTGQGFLFARSVPEAELRAIVREQRRLPS
ncbi:EAL domain-containing protein [Aquabacter spiritensis]|uniref:EAL domain-containing protein (Putative c-di-GMP-specific phosphodiesterase class I) n=1 Tax=Aquabacter spiritensis TaxID=933073 RepID=A0A4R3LVF1_9HYPH|nr:EAL domain-containing protein [Aquabacter spiritensis]TCT02655.1 EAL domain-containing protein (putative c-di-GMP-specific phosphodiesterase class I) [Aquabacter spiritensis]